MKRRYELLVVLVSMLFAGSCTMLETEEKDADIQSKIDFTYGTKESGKVRKEFHYNNSDDYVVLSEIFYVYNEEQIAEKIFTDYRTSKPVVMQVDTFLYNGEKLYSQLQLLRETATDGNLKISKKYRYGYPTANTKTKAVVNYNGTVEDSIVYVYNGELLISETHFNKNTSGGFRFEYNSNSKLTVVTNLNGVKEYENQYDENGLLAKTLIYKDGELSTTIFFERSTEGEKLSIKKYVQKAGTTEKILNSIKVFESGRLVELDEYATAPCGSIWWCTRYQYH